MVKYIGKMSDWYHSLVNKNLSRSLFFSGSSSEAESLEIFEPFITISRDPGSGGKPIAQLVAKKLGFEFYDEKLLEEIAKSAKARKEVMRGVDERQRTVIEDMLHNVLNPEYISEKRYITHLCKVVLSVAKKGKVVFLGRGSNFIAPNAYGLNVRVTAPYRVCVSRAVQYEKVPHKKAREIIRKISAERAGFVKQYFGKDIANPKYYDLVLNTTYMKMSDAANIIALAFKQKFS